ncbi:protein PUTATIVE RECOMBINATION INITIATION DEFECT 1 isoform X1 [Primulina huaijiensis]|uniref:protein PUTATIVE RECOMBINATION INITIATION DEFECT 1 isoform X1 n=2 Tax=Primulina huaijiensis TaxID=1492673 RepID=UPI003CC73D2F
MHPTAALSLQPPLKPPVTCSQGHSSNLILPTAEGGFICLLCLSVLLSNPKSPTVHVSYALSQLSQAISQSQFLHSLLTFHSHFLISPLVFVLSNFDDEPIANQTIDLILRICEAAKSNSNEDVQMEFAARVSNWLSSGSLAWSRRQLYMLHCFGVLLDSQESKLYASIKDKDSLICNLITGLQLSSEVIQGEIMFVLYRLFLLHFIDMDDNCTDVYAACCPKLVRLPLEVLMKSESEDVRLNCVALLTVLARRGIFQSACINHVGSVNSCEADNFMQTSEHDIDGSSLEVLFAEAVKGPLLSSDSQLQIATLDLIILFLSHRDASGEELQVLIEQNIADYIFEMLRLSGREDPIVNSSLQVLDLLSAAEQPFRQRLAIGFTTLVPILRHVAEVPFHHVQCLLLKLILNCVSNCPGIISTSDVGEISIILTRMFNNLDGEIGMLPETFSLSCRLFVALMKFPSSPGNSIFITSIMDASRSAVSYCLSDSQVHRDQILHFLYLLKEAYAYNKGDGSSKATDMELRICILDLYKIKLLPWFMTVINDLEGEDIALGVIETFHSILLQDSDTHTEKFTVSLVSCSWFSMLFGCLGLFPTERMRDRTYLIFGSVVDVLLGDDSGQPIRDAAFLLPYDPTDLLFLLGQKSSHNQELFCCQSAVLLILYISSLYNDRIADDKLILASLEQYILLNSSDFVVRVSVSVTIELLVNLYGLHRGFAKMSYQIPYSPEAERILFQLLSDIDWNSLSTRIHFTSLKWLFQQEKLWKSLSKQILRFCRQYYSSNGHEITQTINLHVFAELITTGDNFVAMIFIHLLGELVGNTGQDYDIISVVKAMTEITEVAPAVSDQFCMHGIDDVMLSIYLYSRYTSPELHVVISQLVISILISARSESILNDGAWIGIAGKLLDSLTPAVALDGWTEVILTISILSLILHHSSNQVLTEATKTIILSAPLVSTVNITISEACSKGPALLDHDEGTNTGEVLILVLLLLFFSLRSMRANLPGLIDFRFLHDNDTETEMLSYISIRCHDCCKLMHYGSPLVKLISSFCLMEMLTGLSDYINKKTDDLKCREGYMSSLSSVLEGLIFFDDIRVSMNCAQCLSLLMEWEELENESITADKSNWYRLIVEELVMSLVTPSTTSNTFMVHHKPAALIVVALLKSSRVPPWMTKVFDDLSIYKIIQNVSPSNVSTELVVLFRELMNSGYLNSEHIAHLNQVFQACRRHIYNKSEMQYTTATEHTRNTAVNQDHATKARAYLFSLMLSHSVTETNGLRSQCWKELLKEIELFTKCSTEED